MVCYAIPTMAAILLHIGRRNPSLKEEKYKTLNLLLFGGAIFGVVDHLWNGELFLIGPNMLSDLLLGFAITAAIFVTWSVMTYLEAAAQKNTANAAN